MLGKGVVTEKCCREVFEKSVAEKCWEGSCCREVLGKIVVEKCWRSRTVLEKGVGEKCCRGVLETVFLQVKNQHLSVQLWALCCCVVGAAFTVTLQRCNISCVRQKEWPFQICIRVRELCSIFFREPTVSFCFFCWFAGCVFNSTEPPTMWTPVKAKPK